MSPRDQVRARSRACTGVSPGQDGCRGLASRVPGAPTSRALSALSPHSHPALVSGGNRGWISRPHNSCSFWFAFPRDRMEGRRKLAGRGGVRGRGGVPTLAPSHLGLQGWSLLGTGTDRTPRNANAALHPGWDRDCAQVTRPQTVAWSDLHGSGPCFLRVKRSARSATGNFKATPREGSSF